MPQIGGKWNREKEGLELYSLEGYCGGYVSNVIGISKGDFQCCKYNF